MPKRIAVFLLLVLVACVETERDNSAEPAVPPATEVAVSSFSVVDTSTGQVTAEKTLEDGSSLNLDKLGDLAFQANLTSPDLSRADLDHVAFTFDGQVYVDRRAPYRFPGAAIPERQLRAGAHTLSATPYRADGSAGQSLAVSFSAAPPERYLYVFRTAAIEVYDVGNDHQKVKSLALPAGIARIWGAVAHAESGRLYIAYHGRDEEKRFETGLIAYDLLEEEVIWKELYKPFVDSPAITEDGKTIYLSSGEATDRGDFWFVLDAEDGSVKDKIEVFQGAHNTVIGLGGQNLYMGSVRYPYLVVADTATNQIVREIGPFRAGVRPFTVNGEETLAFVNVNNFLGFEVGDIATGEVLYSVRVEGFEERDFTEELDVQSHGVALSPDERELWVADNGNSYLHLYDVSALPEKAPVYLESIHLPRRPNWVQFSRDGRFAYSSGGEVIDTATRQVITRIASAKVRVQIDFIDGRPSDAYVRYGLGYVTD